MKLISATTADPSLAQSPDLKILPEGPQTVRANRNLVLTCRAQVRTNQSRLVTLLSYYMYKLECNPEKIVYYTIIMSRFQTLN